MNAPSVRPLLRSAQGSDATWVLRFFVVGTTLVETNPGQACSECLGGLNGRDILASPLTCVTMDTSHQ